MKKVMLVMYRKFIAQNLVKSMTDNSRFEFFTEYNYKNAPAAANFFEPSLALVEIPESESGQAMDYIAVCAKIKKAAPRCKLMLFFSENSPESKSAAIAAKRLGELDDFVFFDTSWNYLVSKIEAL